MSYVETGVVEDTGRFQLLVVDDECKVPTEVSRQFEDDPSVEIIEASNLTEATARLQARYIDAAIVDIELNGRRTGFEVIREIGRLAPTAVVLIVTKLNDIEHSFLANERPRVIAIYEKQHHLHEDWALQALGPTLTAFREQAVALRGLDVAANLLDLPDRRKRIPDLRSREQIAVELERLCRRIFGQVSGIGEPVEVELSAIKRAGLGPAITVAASVHVGKDFVDEELPGAVTVLKIGPREEIEAEAQRYEAFVKYGVRLTHRVELLGAACEQTLGAISYSFAGGVFGVSLTSLDDLLRSNSHQAIVDEALEDLFQVSSRNWYRVKLRPLPPSSYFLAETKLDIRRSYERLEGGMRRLRNRFAGQVAFDPPGKQAGELRIGEKVVRIPTVSIWGVGAFIEAQPTSLIHGDMHAGNVLVELAEHAAAGEPTTLKLRRVCLIDFRNAGRGPRLLDFVSLEASVRLADAESILPGANEQAGNGQNDTRLLEALRCAAARVEDERRLLAARYDREALPAPEGWQRRVLRLHDMAHWNFDEIREEEYLTLASLYVLRQLGYSHGQVARVRLLAWMDALTRRLLGTVGKASS